MNKRPLIIVAVILAIIIAVIVVISIFSIQQSKYITINVQAVPVDSQITLDGKPIAAGEIRLKPGEHTLIANHIYFTDDIQIIDTSKLQSGLTIYLLPKADTPEAKQWQIDHPIGGELSESVGSYISIQRANTAYELYPQLRNLPYKALNFEISYNFDLDYNLTYYIKLFPYSSPDDVKSYDYQLATYKLQALEFLTRLGVDVSSAKIQYTPEKAASL